MDMNMEHQKEIMQLIHLPVDVLVTIFSHLSYCDLRNVMLTCKTLRHVVMTENSIWREVSRDKLVLSNNLDNSRNKLTRYNRCRISRNWCKGLYRNKVATYDRMLYMPWLRFYNSDALLLAVGSELLCYERDRKGFPLCQRTLWRLQVPTVKRYDVRTNDISRFTAKNDLIVCGNRDGCVAIYSVANIRRRPELLCHLTDCHRGGLAEVSAVELSCRSGKLHVATGSDCAKNLYIWSVRPGSKAYCELDISIGDNVGVRSLSMDSAGERLAVGLNGNNMPIMVYMATGQVSLSSDATRSLKQVVRDIQWHDEHTLAFVTHYGSIKMLDVRSGNVVYRAADPFQSSLYCIRTDGRHAVVVGAAEYSRCVLFDARRASRHVQIYFTQKVSSPIYSLDFDCTKLVAAADRSAAILNFNVSDSNATLRDYSQTFEVINTVPYYDFDNADLPLVVP